MVLLIVMFFINMLTSNNVNALSCYTGTCLSGVDSTSACLAKLTKLVIDGAESCTTYGFACTDQDTACTADQKTAKTVKINFTGVSTATCTQISSDLYKTVYMHAKCCTTDNCNSPDVAAAAGSSFLATASSNGENLQMVLSSAVVLVVGCVAALF
jgi:hypothetical protein